MADQDELQTMVQAMITAGKGRDEIIKAIQDYDAKARDPKTVVAGMRAPQWGDPVQNRADYEKVNALHRQNFNQAIDPENAVQNYALVGGMLGGPLGAAAGGAGGTLVRDLNRANKGDPRTPKTGIEAGLNVAGNAAGQGLLAKGGDVVGQGVVKGGEWVASKAVPLVRSALKPALTELRHRSGIEGVTPSVVANRIAKFIVDNKLASAEQARKMMSGLSTTIDDAIKAAESNPNVSPVLDVANRVPTYLQNLLKGVEKQMTPGRDRSAIQNFGKELVEDSPLSQYVPSTAVPRSTTGRTGFAAGEGGGFTLEAPSGMQAAGGSSRPRALRANVTPSEGWEIARQKSFFDPTQTGAQRAGGRTTERALRDAVKEAVPETRVPLTQWGRAKDAERALDRMAWRDANRDQASLAAQFGFGSGNTLRGALLNTLKEGQLKAGIAAPEVGKFIGRQAPKASLATFLAGQALLDQILSQEPPK